MRSLSEQRDAMGRQWPDFNCWETGVQCVTWRGELAPVQRRYEVTVQYGLPQPWGLQDWIRGALRPGGYADLCRVFPVVRVLSPALELRPDAPEEAPLPHVYLDPEMPRLSPLCLFDPSLGEWTPDDLIADTTIPWTADWLACYEGWLATGRWPGGGRPVRTVLHDAR